MEEIWKPVEGFEGRYEVSNMGNVKIPNYRGTGRERMMKFQTDICGYFTVSLFKNGKSSKKRVNRLVASAFCPNPNNYPVVNHKNEIKIDNRADNLEWCTVQYNTTYGSGIEKMIQTRNQLNCCNKERKVYGISIVDGSRIEFDSVTEANKNGFYNICKSIIGERAHANGYKWFYQ